MNEVTATKKSDLGVRVASAIVMVGMAGTALWLGGVFWIAFVVVVALGVFWEWNSLAFVISTGTAQRIAWIIVGLVYLTVAGWLLVDNRNQHDGIFGVGTLLLTVIGVDVGAYFAGRSIGGPKIAPSVSPSKTWSGLFGGAISGGLLYCMITWAWSAGLCRAYINSINEAHLFSDTFSLDDRCHLSVPTLFDVLIWFLPIGLLFAIIAQSGDFFESWMKRRAGVKDSGNLIPGHGGLFDRVDGLLAVCFIFGVLQLL